MEKGFEIKKIDEKIYERIRGKSFKAECEIKLEDLRYLKVLHKDMRGEKHEGELICNMYIALDLLDIFEKLYEASYPIEKIRLIDEYEADDEKAMRDNNTSCFNYRLISHKKEISKHGLGLAVDVNALYNPYIKKVEGKRILEPATAEKYVDREKKFPYKITAKDMCCRKFKEHGFEWGGEWEDRKDYQHFEIPYEKIKILYPEIYGK